MRKEESKVAKDMRRVINDWADEGLVQTLAIDEHFTDPDSRLINFGGALTIPLHQGWKPPVGSDQKVKFLKTKRGRTLYAVPADMAQVPKPTPEFPEKEFDNDRQRTFIAILRKGKNGYYFRMDSGLILVPLDQKYWQEQDALHNNSLVGRNIELMGIAKNTCYLVMPRHKDVLGSTQVDLGDDTAWKKQVAIERAKGIIRVSLDNEQMPILATAILGMTREDALTNKSIDTKYREAIKACPESKDIINVVGLPLLRSIYIEAVQDARGLLKELAKNGVKCLADLYADGQAEQIAAVETGEAEETYTIACGNCDHQFDVNDTDFIWAEIVECPACHKANGPLINCSTELIGKNIIGILGANEKQLEKLYDADIITVDQLAKETKEHLMQVLGLARATIPNKLLKAARTLCPQE